METTTARAHEVTLSSRKANPLQIHSIVSFSAGKAFASVAASLSDPKFIQTLLEGKTWCFVSPEGFLGLFANKEQKEGWYRIVKDQNGNLRELVHIETREAGKYEKNEMVYIFESAFQRAREGEPLALGRDYGVRGGRLYLVGDYGYGGGDVAWVALESQAQARPGQGGKTQVDPRELRNDGEKLWELASRAKNSEGMDRGTYLMRREDLEFLRNLARKLSSLPGEE